MNVQHEGVKEQSFRLDTCSINDFIFLALAYEGQLPVLSLAVSSSRRQCMASIYIMGELAGGAEMEQ